MIGSAAGALIYFALAIAAATTLFSQEKVAYAIGGIVLRLLLLGIRNAWDLAMSLARRAHEQHN